MRHVQQFILIVLRLIAEDNLELSVVPGWDNGMEAGCVTDRSREDSQTSRPLSPLVF